MTFPLPASARRHRLQGHPSSDGFTLVELLMAVVLGSLVLGALGGALLVSQMRVSTMIRRDLERKDSLNRAITLIRSEINRASSVSSSQTGGASWNICAAPSLRISTPGLQDICYKVTTSSLAVNSGYGSGTDRPWTGSCLLMRQGPRFDAASGQPNAASNALPIAQVILDDLAGGCSSAAFNFSIAAAPSSSGQALSRDVSITITQANGAATSFSAHTGSNPLYSGNEMNVPSCTSGTCHWKPNFGSPAPITSADKKNIFYFKTLYNPSDVGPCSYASCTVRSGSDSLTLQYVDVLVFADKEIRP